MLMKFRPELQRTSDFSIWIFVSTNLGTSPKRENFPSKLVGEANYLVSKDFPSSV
jgi:hypothetical protein